MSRTRSALVAVAALGASTLVALGFDSVLRMGRASVVLYLPAVFAATALCGQWCGLTVTVLSLLAAELVIPHAHPTARIVVAEAAGYAVFAVVAVWSTILAGRLGRAREAADLATADAVRRSDELVRAHEQVAVLRRAAEQRARDFATLFDEAPIGIGIAEDVDCKRITPNHAFARMLGIPQSENISQTADRGTARHLRISTPDGVPMSADELPMQRAARTGRPVRGVDLDILRDDGTLLSLIEFAAPLLDDHGRPRGSIGAFLDMTAQRRAEHAKGFLGEATHLLLSSLDPERTLSHLVRLAVPRMADSSVLDVIGEDGEVTRAGIAHRDPAIERLMLEAMLRVPPGQGMRLRRGLLEIVPEGASRLIAVATTDAICAAGFTAQYAEFARSIGVNSLLVTPMVLKGEVIGAFSWTRMEGRPHYDAADVELAQTVAGRAVSAIEKGRLYREAQTASRLREEFVATLSHELRTPLNALLGWVELAKSGRLSPDKQRQALDAIERTARLQAQITNDLVDVSRAASGKFRLTPREVDVAEIVHTSVDSFRLAAESKGLALRVAVAPDLPRAYVDPDRFQQIVFNLVANAVKFTPAGAVDVAVRVQTGWLEVVVTDTGIGIAPRFLPYVFDRFRQADGSTTRQYGGMGLGLSIVRALVELHGGMVNAQSDGVDRGATFTVWIPVAPGSAAMPTPTGVRTGVPSP